MMWLLTVTLWGYQAELRSAIDAVSSDPWERAQLWRIAEWEGGFREDIGRCQVLGDSGRAYGAFQVWPRSMAERLMTCASLEGAAALALERVRESVRACSREPERWRLSLYASGSCTNAGGRIASERRWVQR